MALIDTLKADMTKARVAAQAATSNAVEKAKASLTAKALSTVIGRAEQRRKTATDVVTDESIQAELKSLVEGLTDLKNSLEAAGRKEDAVVVAQEMALYNSYRPSQLDVAVVNAKIDEIVESYPVEKRTPALKGQVMPVLMKTFGKGTFDANAASQYLSSKLS